MRVLVDNITVTAAPVLEVANGGAATLGVTDLTVAAAVATITTIVTVTAITLIVSLLLSVQPIA